MGILVITDIPRMTGLFEQLAYQYPELVVVSEIHRGIEELERSKPEVVIFQNRLSGLSADILHKHLQSRLGGQQVRFGLISPAREIEPEMAARFAAVLDPALPDAALEATLQRLVQGKSDRVAESAPAVEEPAAPLQQPPQEPPALEQTGQYPLVPPAPATLQELQAEADTEPGLPMTYDAARRPSSGPIISDFSRQLDTSSDKLQPEPDPFPHREESLALRDLYREPHLVTDLEEEPAWYRRPGTLLTLVTLAVVLVVSLLQYRTQRKTAAPKAPSASGPAAVATVPQPSTVKQPAPPVPSVPSASPLVSHGAGRLRQLPAFVPKEGRDNGYSKEHAGWELYLSQTSEYRIFREKDGGIKAVQVIDRSGSGLQESFYVSVLKELAGVTAMRPSSSDVKEGYEVRRGTAAGLQIVQYRDAQGGRLRGFVITWP